MADPSKPACIRSRLIYLEIQMDIQFSNYSKVPIHKTFEFIFFLRSKFIKGSKSIHVLLTDGLTQVCMSAYIKGLGILFLLS